MGSTGSGSYGPACSFNPVATAAGLTTTTGSTVYSFGGINLGVQDMPAYALSCEHATACNYGNPAGVANNNSLIQSAVSQSKIVEYIAIGLLGVGLFFLWKRLRK
jgi:hypothetical protein